MSYEISTDNKDKGITGMLSTRHSHSTSCSSSNKSAEISHKTFLSSLYFSSCMGNAAWSKFSNLYFLENGITATQLGVLSSIQSVAKLIGYPTFGLIADAFGNAKVLLLVSLTIGNVILLFFYFPLTNEIIFGNFWILVCIRGIRSYSNCIWSLIDAVTMRMIPDKKTYGKHRLFASIAWGISAMFVGKLIDVFGMNTMFTYGLFWSSITFAIIFIWMPSDAEISQVEKHKYESLNTEEINQEDIQMGGNQSRNGAENRPNPSNDRYDFCQMFKLLASMKNDGEFMWSLGIMLIYWNAMFIVDRVLFIQMEQQFHATKFMNGIATFCSTLTAVPVFYYSSKLMKSYPLNGLYLFCHIVLAIRLCAYVLVKDLSMVRMIYVIELWHGINFGLGFAVCRVYLYQLGDGYSVENNVDVRATIQSLKGIITLVSIFSGGIMWLPLYDCQGANFVYILGASTLIPSIITLWIRQSNNQKLFNARDTNTYNVPRANNVSRV